ncbi:MULTISPECIES: flagellar hook-associated protein FlgL [unclassified Simplicispira]|uniref:flagellar hook-associated protein FlgL n=1 Tax=unclassified Simplicispira TaxID=2630407 RepID=UPI000D5C4C93|nr:MULTISPECIES: flagellar hook-associated protein FlgL [unclassified Simplicispira]PVY56997.1 flagellar hook-associated protein 3 FlgL [Simplicispira sp. 125]REG17942.1 flagellar hook-associated protein 3 FlgL [Simplicispira sp. 110]
MSNNLYRLGTANQYDMALRNIGQRQTSLSNLQENLTSGKRVVRASDDPVAAAQAERAQTRISRNTTDLRALDMQRNTMALAESTLGEAGDAMQAFRALVVSAGNGTHTQTERDAIAQQLVSLRDQILGYANRNDANGLPLFQALGSAQTPFNGTTPAFNFAGLPGQNASSNTQIAKVLDGEAAWMSVPTGNGVFQVALNAGNTGKAWAEVGQVTNPSALTGQDYSITFSVVGGVTTYDVVNTTTATPVLSGQPYTSPSTIAFDGMSLKMTGVPNNGDSFDISPSEQSNVFQVLENVIGTIRNGGNLDGSTDFGGLTHGITRGLTEIDSAMNRLQASRGLAGDLLNRADRIEGDLDTRAVQLEADRSRAEDLDMIKGLSDFQNQQVGYEAALKSYSMVQKLSLFNFIS